MTTRTSIIFKALNIIFWVIFVGLCIKTGALLISFIVSLFVNSDGAKNLYLGLNLYDLFTFNSVHYTFIASAIILLTALKAYIAFLVVKIFLNFKLTSPFNTNVSLLLSKISYVALGAGILAIGATIYSNWLLKQGVAIAQDWGVGEILFFASVIYIVSEVFKKGTAIQTENDLTV
jgi:hypothetical protein